MTTEAGREAPTPQEEFLRLCRRHDLTYAYSDDHRYWTRGQQTLKELKAFAKDNLSPEEATTIWNSVVDTKIAEGHRETFYAKETFFK